MEINEILVTESGDDTTGDDNVTKQEAGMAEINKLNLQAPTVDSQNRSRSPVTVQEWVAALPSLETHDTIEQEKGEEKDMEVKHEEDIDNIKLGEEAGFYSPGAGGAKNFGQLLLQKNNKSIRGPGPLQHSDTLASIKSDATNSSMDSVLQSRTADPEEVLYNLGFADSEALAKIPPRFFQRPSVAKGVSIENFCRQQEEMFGRYESGFFGYRGLQGGLHRRPSELVDKILKTLREREREFQRSGSMLSTGCHSIPSRFKVMDPNRTTFDSLVAQVARSSEKDKTPKTAFKSLARSVLSKENRIWRQEQIQSNNNEKVKQLLVIGGKSFIVDDDGNEEELEDEDSRNVFNKIDSKHSMHSGESGFNEEDEEAETESSQGKSENSSLTQLLYTRNEKKNSFTETLKPENVDKNAN